MDQRPPHTYAPVPKPRWVKNARRNVVIRAPERGRCRTYEGHAGGTCSVRCARRAPAGTVINMTSLQPELAVRQGRDAVAFYVAAFGATEIYRVGGTDESPSLVAQLTVGDATFWVSDEAPES